jgi:hypothetical protein
MVATKLRRAERRLWIEWLLVGRRRFWIALGFLLMLGIALAVQLLYADGVSHLSHSELRQFVHRQERYPRTYGPILERLHSE